LEGFPKTKQQGLILQKAGYKTFIILTMSDQRIFESCIQKINQEGDMINGFLKVAFKKLIKKAI